jgi:hypothetical protein
LYFNDRGERVPGPSSDLEVTNIYAKYVGCGKCLACRINKRREWTLRLCHEEVFSDTAYFVTLTYDEQHVPIDDNGYMAVCKRDVQLFLKRLRKDNPGVKIRFFLNSEYGELGRPHYHMLLFNVPAEKMFSESRTIRRGRSRSFTCPYLYKIWKAGNVEFGIASKERAGYCAKYFIDRKGVPDEITPNFSLMSRDPGIGYEYQDKIAEKVRYYGLYACLNSSGTYVPLPRYYRNKIYTEEQRRESFVSQLEVSDTEYESMLRNADIVEENRYRALHWKGKKQKL